MPNTIADPIKTYAFSGHSGDRAVVMVRDLRCPKCQSELTAESVSADLFGGMVVQCVACRSVVLAVSCRGRAGRAV
jgi:cytochrome c-type biogenesis protein CcmH/NrfF